MTPSTRQASSRLLWSLSARQHGVVTRRQLLEHGLSADAIRHRLAEGRLHPLLRGVYAVGRPQVSREGRWLAAVLACGTGAVLSHSSAAALYAVRETRRSTVEVTVPHLWMPLRPGIRAHRSTLAREDVVVRDGIPVVSPARMLLNQAAALGARQLERDINVADARGLITVDALQSELARFVAQPGVVALRNLLERHTLVLTDSELERMFLPLTASAGLPAPLTGRRVNGFKVDFCWPGLGLVVETDGLRYHRTPTQQARDLVREQTHRAAGIEPLRFTHHQVAYAQEWVERTLRLVAQRLRATR
jgi:putative AbiEi antitoxin of type IV toxin-antitoxin system/uncharacterized protein DUF559